MYKSINGQLPDSLTSMLKQMENVHNDNLWNYDKNNNNNNNT